MSTLFTKYGFNELNDVIQAVNYNTNYNNNTSLSVSVGRVFGTVTTFNTPSQAAFVDSRVGGYSGIGSIFFKDYESSKNEKNTEEDKLFASCDVASPLFPHITYYPLIGELVYILFLPSAGSQIGDKKVGTYYYLSPINLWFNGSVNAQAPDPNASLGQTFIENSDLKNLLSFEGDFILQGRKGNSIRLGSSVKKLPYLNEWSDFGKDGDPITILYNGIGGSPDLSDYSIEKINNPGISALYLTTSQRIPLEAPAADTKTFFSTGKKFAVDKYNDGSQAILTADRVVLNAKKDQVLIFADKSIELSTKNIISLNSDTYIHLNVTHPELKRKSRDKIKPSILLGTKPNGDIPDEPLVLGLQLEDFLSDLLKQLSTFASRLMPSAAPQEGSPIMELQSASEDLVDALEELEKKIESIKSKNNFTV